MKDIKLEKLYSIWYDSPKVQPTYYEKIKFLDDIRKNLQKTKDNLKLFSIAVNLDEKRVLDVHSEKITHIDYGKGKIIYIIKKGKEETFKVGFKPDKKSKIEIEFDFYNYNKFSKIWSNLNLSKNQIKVYNNLILDYYNYIGKELLFKEVFIERKLNKILADFKINVKNKKELCELNNLTYKNNIPDYNNEFLQQYYLLRYLYSYFYEYYMTYKKLIELNFLNPPYNIISVGAGSYIDLSAFKYSLIDTQKLKEINYKYTAIDKVNWKYKPQEKNIDFLNDDISNINEIPNLSQSNIFIFPKSLTELEQNHLIKKFNLDKNKREKIVLIASHIESNYNKDQNKQYDQRKFYELTKEGINNTEFEFVDNFQDTIYNFQENLKDNFPRNIRIYLINLLGDCLNLNRCYNNSCSIDYYPKTTVDSISQIIKLERNEYPDVPF